MKDIKYPEELQWQAQISLVRKLEQLQAKARRRRKIPTISLHGHHIDHQATGTTESQLSQTRVQNG